MQQRRGIRAIQWLLIAGGTGSLWGVARAWLEIRAQGYPGLGYRHTMAGALDAGAWAGCALGCAAGLVLVVAAAAVAWRTGDRRAADGGPDWTGWLRERASLPTSYLAISLALLAVFGLIGFRHGGVSDDTLVWLAIAVAAMALAVVLTLAIAGRDGRRGALALGFLVFATTTVAGAFRLNADRGFTNDPDHLAAHGLVLGAALVAGLGIALVSSRRSGLVGWLAAAALPVAVLGGVQAYAATSPPSLRVGNVRNVLLIGIDTLRVDHTTLGAERDPDRSLTPRLAELGRRGTRFDAAVSQAPWTLPAFSSIITGRYPAEHGAYSLTGLLGRGELTLAEILHEAGYRTMAVVSHDYVARKHGFGQGFDAFDESNVRGRLAVTSPGVTDRAIEQIEAALEGDRPFFQFVHYFDPHYAYIDHEGWDFSDGYHGWLREEPFHILNFRGKRQWLGADDIRWLVDLYDEEIAFTDREIGRLLDFLSERDLDGSTAVVVVADHGEEFMERGWLGHTVTLNLENVDVPLLMALPGVDDPAPVVSRPVETRAIFPTLLDYLEIGGGGEASLPGSLMPTILGRPFEGPSEAYSMTWLDEDACVQQGKCVRLSSVRVDDWKLIIDYRRGVTSLYDLSVDPLESRDLSAEQPEKLAELRERVLEWERRMAENASVGGQADLNEEERQRLKSLGYL